MMTDPIIEEEELKRSKRVKQYKQYQEQLDALDKAEKKGQLKGKTVSKVKPEDSPALGIFKNTLPKKG